MSANPESVSVQPLNFRRYKDGDHKPGPWQKQIFNADHSHKCPTYIQSTPPCQGSCPSGEDIRGYLNIVRGVEKPPAGMPWQEYAFRRLTEANPFPSVMGRVCPAPCESGCNRNQVEDFVGINSVEHFLGEYAIANNLGFKKPDFSSGKKVAVIGGGPAGLSTAYQLALRGHAVTLFDERAELGGMMRYGIPGFRTPRQVLDAEIQRILDLGVVARTNCRIGTDITMEQIRADFDAVFLGLGAQSGRGLPVEGADAPNCVTATSFLKAFNDGRLRHVGKRVVVVGGGDTSIDVATVARRLGHIDQIHESDRPEHAIAGHVAHDVAAVSAKQGADVTLTSIFAVDKMQASRHEVEHALSEGIAIRGGLAPVGVVRGPDGRATALRVIRCEAKIVGGKLEIKNIEGTEEDLPADLIVSAIGQAVDFTGLEEFNNGKGAVPADKNYQVQPGVFAGGDIIRPHLLTTAIGHGAIAAEGIDRFLQGEALEKRPKIDVHTFDLQRKMIEKGLSFSEVHEPIHGTDKSNVAIHNFDNRSDRYVISHKELFLGHFAYTPRNRRTIVSLTAEEALGNFDERLQALVEAQAQAEAKRCMSCGQCFECDNCVVYCPQTAVFKVPKSKSTTGRYVDTDYSKCIGCHICQDVCPTGYIQMGLGE
ncbi:MAG TPA: glutamate synthase [Hydrogenophaga sp.]|uniref:NAD(P)-binding protein n=1 Tax=Hydrogenophaga sp. TaxID=1904254 RepID=UPI0008B21B77|nr:NAD(P)-binding protein [Hydrogenophaga sp.]MBU4181036.1 NAD(P)-binding protein [Gammaproteobacteria bacterium]OGA75554.1 MAG: glutamate synthase [Burkholderiales bacterium GWE1_65_30]OGA93680.1 MAG: glutamate synthase [Burkholderiales bacterium GWF1_66_17]OGB14487.1 MAG: glutamate synthase [Burkholderiales bacterium RIFCSPHIGHO2_02_FULL_66_10]OGB31643.1 MAG: glutamate synthase [Burkholderiales bacterium RIFCSPLOWO2_02_FULL_66_35]PKO74325.1 MAG: glutamate synthase [Betaproteobacteria bacter